MRWNQTGEGEPGATLVPVVWFEVVRRWETRNKEKLSSLFFHKISTLTRFRMEEKRLPIPLPYSWYLFGTAAADLPHAVNFYADPESSETQVEWRGPEPELFEGDRVADAIRETIDSILTDYTPERGESAVDEVYTHAPFEFQRKFRRLRIAAGLTGLGSAERESLNVAGGIWGLLLDALDEFPYDNFSPLASSVAIVREAVNVGINVNLDQRKALAIEVIEGFWTAFCGYLRLDPQGHKNVSPATLQHWRKSAEVRRQVFERNLADVVVELARWEPSVERDATLAPVVERRRREQSEDERLVEEGLEVLAGAESPAAAGSTGS